MIENVIIFDMYVVLFLISIFIGQFVDTVHYNYVSTVIDCVLFFDMQQEYIHPTLLLKAIYEPVVFKMLN